jgi:hypothetical protein
MRGLTDPAQARQHGRGEKGQKVKIDRVAGCKYDVVRAQAIVFAIAGFQSKMELSVAARDLRNRASEPHRNFADDAVSHERAAEGAERLHSSGARLRGQGVDKPWGSGTHSQCPSVADTA